MSSPLWSITATSRSVNTSSTSTAQANRRQRARGKTDSRITRGAACTSIANPPALRDKRVLPEGVVPKQAQGYVLAGLAVLILLAVMFSKNHAKTTPAALPNGTPFSSDANARKIAELEQNLSAEQRQSQQEAQQQKSSAAGVAGTTPGTVASTQVGGRRLCFAVSGACRHRTAPRSHRGCGKGNGIQGAVRLKPCLCRCRRFAPIGFSSGPPLTRSPARRQIRSRRRLVLRTRHRKLLLRSPPLRISVRQRSTSTPRTANPLSSMRAPPSTRFSRTGLTVSLLARSRSWCRIPSTAMMVSMF